MGLGSKLSHIHQDINLNGRAATAEVNGVTFASNHQKISYYTQQHHKAQGTHSDLLYKEVLRDDARVIWRGMIKVDPAAQQTDGYQRSDALMLSDHARCDSQFPDWKLKQTTSAARMVRRWDVSIRIRSSIA